MVKDFWMLWVSQIAQVCFSACLIMFVIINLTSIRPAVARTRSCLRTILMNLSGLFMMVLGNIATNSAMPVAVFKPKQLASALQFLLSLSLQCQSSAHQKDGPSLRQRKASRRLRHSGLRLIGRSRRQRQAKQPRHLRRSVCHRQLRERPSASRRQPK